MNFGEHLRRLALGNPIDTTDIAEEAERLLPEIYRQHKENRTGASLSEPARFFMDKANKKRKEVEAEEEEEEEAPRSKRQRYEEALGISLLDARQRKDFTNVLGIPVPNAIAKTLEKSRKRPREEEEDEEEDAYDDDEEEEPPSQSVMSRKIAKARGTQSPAISQQSTVPHAPAVEDVVFVPLSEAIESVDRINAFYRRMAYKDAMTDESRRCFLCEYGNKMFDNSPDYGCRPYATLIAFPKENYPHVSNRGIAINMKRYYDKSIHGPALIYKQRHGLTDEQFPIPAMSVEMFEEHIVDHHLNPYVQIGEDIRAAKKIQKLIENRLIHRGSQNIDLKAVDAWVKLGKYKHSLSMTPRDRLIFGSGTADTLELDATRMGHMGNLKRIESLMVSKTSTAGGLRGADPAETTGDRYRSNFTVEGLTDDQPLDVRPVATPTATGISDDEFLAASIRALEGGEDGDAMDIDGGK